MSVVFLVALWLFVLTHVDTFVALVAFCANKKYRPWEVVVGHYLGFSLGLLLALLGALLATEFLQSWTFLLGIVPLMLGGWGVFRHRSGSDLPEQVDVPSPIDRVGVVTTTGIGLSGENVAVFIPFFVTLSSSELAAILVLYLVCAGVVFVLASFVTRHAAVFDLPDWLDRWLDQWLVPVTLLVVGVYVLGAGWLA